MASKQGQAPYIDPHTLDFVLSRLSGPNAARNIAILHIPTTSGCAPKKSRH